MIQLMEMICEVYRIKANAQMPTRDLAHVLSKIRVAQRKLEVLSLGIEEEILIRQQDFVVARCSHVLPQEIIHCILDCLQSEPDEFTKTVWARRFGLNGAVPETLVQVARKTGITRECVRSKIHRSCYHLQENLYRDKSRRFSHAVAQAEQLLTTLIGGHSSHCKLK